MFKSVTLRLTGWYLLILMMLSLIFSICIYQIESNQIPARLESFQTNIQESQFYINNSSDTNKNNRLREIEIKNSLSALSTELLYVNIVVLVLGGLGSYLLAKHNLNPIKKAHEAQSRFTSDASHELRTPLATMKTEIEVALRDDKSTTSDLKKVLLSNLEEVDRLSKLSEMLLSISHLEHNKLKFGAVNLNKLFDGVIKDFRKSSRKITVKGSRRLIVHGNDLAITDLIKVLVENAIQYSPKNSEITVNFSKFDDYAKFEITNTGKGIEHDKLPYIFDRFYRSDSSRTNGDRKGYGLGLALAKNIIELHKGRLFASSTPDIETTFSFLIPLTKRQKNIDLS